MPTSSVRTPVPNDRRFVITRHGRPIGEHSVSFRRAEDDVQVSTRAALAIRLGFITLYQLEHESEECWRRGRLARFQATTRENGGRPLRLRGTACDRGFRLEAPDEILLPENIFTSDSLWNRAILAQRTILDAHSGQLLELTSEPRSSGQIVLAGAGLAVQEYAFTTPRLRGSIWYDEAGDWVAARFDLRGESIEYRLAQQ